MGDQGIAYDIYSFLLRLINQGRGVQQTYTTPGVNNLNIKLLENTGIPIPHITILNAGAQTAYVGYGSVDSTHGFTLISGASITLEWKNPRAAQLVACDGGTATTLCVIG